MNWTVSISGQLMKVQIMCRQRPFQNHLKHMSSCPTIRIHPVSVFSVTCIHPGWPPLRGRKPVVQSWRDILANPNAPKITCQNARAYVDAAMAYVLCTEVLAGGQLAATNIFVIEDRTWKMVHHQAGPMQETAPKPPIKKPTLQ